MHSLGRTVNKPLFSETECVGFRVTSDLFVDVPVVVAVTLTAGRVVAMGLDVHLVVVGLLLETTALGVKYLLCVGTVFGRDPESSTAVHRRFGPVVVAVEFLA